MDESGYDLFKDTKLTTEKFNYLNMVRDGSMALLRALTVSLDDNYGIDICDHKNHQQDDQTLYYHLVICAESTVRQE